MAKSTYSRRQNRSSFHSILKSVRALFLPTSLNEKGRHRPATRARNSPRLAIRPVQQLTWFSCTAGVMQMVAAHHGVRLSHARAIWLIGCWPHGASLEAVGAAFSGLGRFRYRSHRSIVVVRGRLERGIAVMAGDNRSYSENHAILLVGITPKGFWINDPAVGRQYWRSAARVIKASDEFVSVERY